MARVKLPQDPWPPQRPGLLARCRDHARVLRDSANFVSERLGTSLLVWLLVGIALALPGGLFLLQLNLAAMTGSWEGRPGLTVYFELGAAPALVDDLAATLRQQPSVQQVVIVSPEDALAEFQAYTDISDALELLGSNPLPASLRAVVAAGAGSEDLEALAALAGAHPGAAEVVVEKTWMERITDLTRVVTRLGVMLAVLFGVGAILITATSVRLAIESRLDELRVLKLVGASNAQMRRPFLYFGAIYGLGGAVFGAMLISLCLVVIEAPLADLLGSYGQALRVTGFDLRFLGTLFGVAVLLGVAGALIAARQRLSGLEIL
ncbi:MAG: cell division protein FtsX [Pseudomonadales bacterium]